MKLRIEQIAEVCHEANRAYCRVIGDDSQLPWSKAPDWQRRSAIGGVTAIMMKQVLSPSQSHENWVHDKIKDGWKWGSVKNANRKEHPDLVEYDKLSPEQRIKDTLFFFITETLANLNR